MWDRLDVAHDILEKLNCQALRQAYPGGAGSTPAAQEALQMAISLDRLALVKELIGQPGADVGAIDLVQARYRRDLGEISCRRGRASAEPAPGAESPATYDQPLWY